MITARSIGGPFAVSAGSTSLFDMSATSGPAAAQIQAEGKKSSWPVFLFLVFLILPWVIYLGPMRLSPYRIVLLLTIIPCLVTWIRGGAGRRRLPDFAILLFAFWGALGLFVIHGFAVAAQSVGIGLIETVGAYFLARCYIRSADDFRNAVRLLFLTVVFLMPFAVIELVTGRNILREVLGLILPTFDVPSSSRSGLTRVVSVFEHPILFGVFAGNMVGLAHLVLGHGQGVVSRTLKSGTAVAMAAMSLSAGPVGAMAAQVLLLVWNSLLRQVRIRWYILIGLLIGVFCLIELVANRSALTIVTSFVLFDNSSYWYRRFIWEFGSATALNHPFFGVGLNDWERPAWMPTASLDNFWLFQAVRSGLAAPFLLLLALLSIVLPVSFRKSLDSKVDAYRTAFVISMAYFFFTGWTVHFWGNVYVLFLFLMGAGVWILEAGEVDGAGSNATFAPLKQFGASTDTRRGVLSTNLASLDWQAPAGHPRRLAPDEILVSSDEWRDGQK